MSWIAVAVAGSAIVGGLIQGNAAQNAASTQAGAAEQAAQIQQQEFQTITQQENPFMQGGYGALSELEYGLGIPNPYGAGGSPYGSGGSILPSSGQTPTRGEGGGWGTGGAYAKNNAVMPRGGQVLPQTGVAPTGQPPGGAPAGGAAGGNGIGYGSLLQPFNTSDWQQLSPAYNFQRQQGQQGTLNADTSGQGALSGAAQKDLMGFNQNLANTSFNNAFNMYQTQQGNIYQRLAGLTQLGQSAAANTGQQGTALAGNAGQAVTNVGTALAGGQVGQANAYAGAMSNAMPYLYAAGQGGGDPYGYSGSGPYTPPDSGG